MQRRAWLASPALETSSPISDTSAHSPHCTLTHFTAFHLGSLLWSFVVLSRGTLQWRMAPPSKLCWGSICARDLPGLLCLKGRWLCSLCREEVTSRMEIPYSFCTSVLSLMNASAVHVPMFLPCPGLRRGLRTQGWAGQRVHSEEMMVEGL